MRLSSIEEISEQMNRSFLSSDGNGEERASSREGLRKVALLLSILECDVADSILKLFDSKTVTVIVKEAERIKKDPISVSEVEAVVSEFLNTFSNLDQKLANAVLQGARNVIGANSVARRNNVVNESSSELEVKSEESSMKVVGERLRKERPTIIGSVISSVSTDCRQDLVELLPADLQTSVQTVRGSFSLTGESDFLTNSVRKRLGRLVLEGALNER